MQQPYTQTSSLEVGVPDVKNCFKSFKMANKKNVREILHWHLDFSYSAKSLEHKNQGFPCQNCLYANSLLDPGLCYNLINAVESTDFYRLYQASSFLVRNSVSSDQILQ